MNNNNTFIPLTSGMEYRVPSYTDRDLMYSLMNDPDVNLNIASSATPTSGFLFSSFLPSACRTNADYYPNNFVNPATAATMPNITYASTLPVTYSTLSAPTNYAPLNGYPIATKLDPPIYSVPTMPPILSPALAQWQPPVLTAYSMPPQTIASPDQIVSSPLSPSTPLTGEEDSRGEKHANSPTMSPSEVPNKKQKIIVDKETARAEQQRMASRKYRQKKKVILEQLESRMKDLADEKETLEKENKDSQDVINKLKKEK